MEASRPPARRERADCPRNRQRPSKTAFPGPFSMKLVMPVFWSSVANSAAKCSRSISSPVARSTSRPWLTACLAARSASAGPAAYWRDHVPGGLVDLGVRHHLVGQADGQRLVRGHVPAGEDEVLGLGRADQPGQPLRAAGAGDDAEQDLGLPDLGALAQHPEVGAEREFEPAAERVAGDRRHHRLGDVRHGGERRLQRGRPRRPSPGTPSAAISLMSAPAAKTRSPP